MKHPEFLYLIWVLFYVFAVECSMLFYPSMSWYNSLLLYSSVLLYCLLLFIFLCSSSCYVCVFDCIYCTSTLPPGINPVTVNKCVSV
jgi:hypothetical protein